MALPLDADVQERQASQSLNDERILGDTRTLATNLRTNSSEGMWGCGGAGEDADTGDRGDSHRQQQRPHA